MRKIISCIEFSIPFSRVTKTQLCVTTHLAHNGFKELSFRPNLIQFGLKLMEIWHLTSG